MGGNFVFAVCFVDCETLLTRRIQQGLHMNPNLHLVVVIENTYISIGPSISILHTRIYHTWRGGTYNRTCQFISKTKMDTAVTSPVAELGRNSASKGNDSRKVTWGNALICLCVLL